MILKINKRLACGFISFIKAALIVYIIFCGSVFSQEATLLNEVEVITKKIEFSQIGKKTEKIDSTIKAQFKLNTIADILSLTTPIFIKNYGPGSLSTTSFRGGNASQTAILWNGFSIQNAMLGQSDLTLMPSFLFENIEVEYGGSSSLWGSGAVGGSIHLKNKSKFNEGLKTSTTFGAGSFGLRNVSATMLISKKRFTSSSKIYNSYSKNNFNYISNLDRQQTIKQQQNAAYNFLGLMQEVNYLINSKQLVSVSAWITSGNRQLPTFDQQPLHLTFQRDNIARITANWNFTTANFKSTLRTGFFEDKINYTDSLAGIFSKNKSRTLIAESENYYSLKKYHTLSLGINFTYNNAVTNNYSYTQTLSKLSLLAGDRCSLLKDKWQSYVNARIEYYSVGSLPVTGNIGTEYHVTKNIHFSANAAKVYRQPTLNELYWMPGGNINLKPEDGYTYEGALSNKHQMGNFLISISGALYSRKINNWILWIPGTNGNPSPVNLQQVWSRGTETTWKINYAKEKFKCHLNVITAYVLSTVVSNNQENNNTLTKQLIYTPRYTFNSNFLIGYGTTSLIFYNQYIGYRYTTSDNSQWLSPYQISSLRLNYSVNTKQLDFIFFMACNNLFNKNYQVLSGRPMPLRNYEFGITLQTKNKK